MAASFGAPASSRPLLGSGAFSPTLAFFGALLQKPGDIHNSTQMGKLAIFLLCSVPLFAQAPGYSVPASGIGLNVCIGPGSNTLSGSVVSYLGSCMTMTQSVTNYGYLDGSSGLLTVAATGVPTASCPVFEADADFFQVTAVRDTRVSLCAGGGAVLANPANFPGTANWYPPAYPFIGLACDPFGSYQTPGLGQMSCVNGPFGGQLMFTPDGASNQQVVTVQPFNSLTNTDGLVPAWSTALGQFQLSSILPSSSGALNVSTYGVTGDGVTNDTVAFQNAINAACNNGQRGVKIIIPNGFNIKLTATINVTKCSGITIDGGNSQGQGTICAASPAGGCGNAAILWFGAVGGTVLSINQTRDSTFSNFTIFTNATEYHNAGANIGILVDEIGSVTNITSNDEFDDINIYNGVVQNANFIGVDICPTAPANCELINFNRLSVSCGGGTVGASTNGTGVLYANSAAQPYYEYIHGIESNQCSKAIDVENGNEIDINGGLANANYTDLMVGGGRNVSYRHIRSEFATAQIVIGTVAASSAHDVTVEENSFSGLTNTTTTIGFAFASTSGIVRLIKNDWDANGTVTPFGPIGGGGFTGSLDSQDNQYPNTTLCITAPFATSGAFFSSNGDRPSGTTCGYGGLHVGRPVGFVQIDPTTFTNLAACSAATEGQQKSLSDSTVNTPGATIAGGGSNHISAYCNGTNWVVGVPPNATYTLTNHPTMQDCGTTSTCANTQKTAALVIRGSVAFPTATTVTVTSLPFTSASSYSCTAGDVTTAAGVVNATTYTSGASVTFTETSGVNTDTMRYTCIGF